LVDTEAFTAARAPSTLDELLDNVFDCALIAARSASMLDDEFESERLEV
jgi:hypothetical protein